MRYLPIGVDLNQKACLVVGAGGVATRKIVRLLDAGAAVTVVADKLDQTVNELHDSGKLTVKERSFSEFDLKGMSFVVAATDSPNLNKTIAQSATNMGIWCNTAENIDENSVIFPSLVRRDPVLISISSDGASPVLARVLSAQLDAFVPTSIGKLALLAKELRQKTKDRFHSIGLRRRFWNQVVTGRVAQMLQSGHEEEARAELHRLLDPSLETEQAPGEVYLVGAGPGRPRITNNESHKINSTR